MTNFRVRQVVFVLCFLLAPLARAAGTSTITYVNGIDFGDFSVLGSCANCEITINPSTGARTATSGVILRSTNVGTRAQFNVTMTNCGGSNCSYTESVTPASLSIATAGGTMTVLSFTSTQTAMTAKANTIYVGATLRIPSVGVTAGTYSSGNFTVTTSN
ncbi:DUF4402 domain-containing protein [Lacisediminimonas sp.]|uniref:DUF4402 domain-containing protein n=1 Tax=Lacisediminimonas sp. TaxID=3060582 RepID=UPI002726181F|nr:DUF4402 domain-containing protein [Lacisediminimonas sp.]MDO8300560.1 DUF4402 domain-containing protein [Lacisediminimonas sp.]MDO9219248.1 DUF4402 domain-containing protein [Lacisediminimonas sp.]